MIRLFPGLKRLLESIDRERFAEPRLCIKPLSNDIKKIKKPNNLLVRTEKDLSIQ